LLKLGIAKKIKTKNAFRQTMNTTNPISENIDSHDA